MTLDKIKLKKDVTEWRINNNMTLRSLAKKMDYSESYMWAALNNNNKFGLGLNFWEAIQKATNNKIKRKNYYS